MKTVMKTAALAKDEASRLRSLLVAEEDAYAGLLQLALAQNSCLRGQDVAGLEANAGDWRDRMPAAEVARTARETYLLELGERHHIGREHLRMSRLARSTGGETGRDLRHSLRSWERTTGELMRQNSLNGMLARFCLGLVDEEANILCNGMTGNDGCYDAQGGERKGACAGVIVRQA
ncbi:flagellar export chaperone FlgN [bacterium]|nr:flagellar export chaperone FlgN [bacterium]